jgi:hypothetical protein
MRGVIVGGLSLCILSTPAWAQRASDMNRDSSVSRDEMRAALLTSHSSRDANRDGFLDTSEIELDPQLRGLFDADQDGRWSEQEWTSYTDLTVTMTFMSCDKDTSEALSEAEMTECGIG